MWYILTKIFMSIPQSTQSVSLNQFLTVTEIIYSCEFIIISGGVHIYTCIQCVFCSLPSWICPSSTYLFHSILLILSGRKLQGTTRKYSHCQTHELVCKCCLKVLPAIILNNTKLHTHVNDILQNFKTHDNDKF